ncbi:MAG: hypothetical protein INQ03_24575 [Candidatus Heimdallarchaeota archaeon]|nr:hypothetical protein [Candidatus Heimdallarchaeota archaeon]
MARYEVSVREELNDKLQRIVTDEDIGDFLSEYIEQGLSEYLIEYIIKIYKDGKLKAREAWKLSGLTYPEFQARAQQ